MAAGRVFIANFGRENYYWPECLQRGVIVTFNDADLQPFWLAGDRVGFIERCVTKKKTSAGITPTKPIASRWFNLMSIVSGTSGDLWIHREKETLWWTTSSAEPAVTTVDRPGPGGDIDVYVFQKPCTPWSNKSRAGSQLLWGVLHPKAKDFLFTEGTLQQLSEDNAAYAHALIDGADLTPARPARSPRRRRRGAG